MLLLCGGNKSWFVRFWGMPLLYRGWTGRWRVEGESENENEVHTRQREREEDEMLVGVLSIVEGKSKREKKRKSGKVFPG